MTAFKTAPDIANRALQHLGVARIYNFADNSPQASECGFSYNPCREAELRANLWRFATRRSVLYPIDVSTRLFTPPTWDTVTTYNTGAIVLDSFGDWWESKTDSNLGNEPDVGDNWGHYFGPDSFDPFVPPAITASAPAAPTLSYTTGGTFGQTTYYVRVSYVGTAGETLVSNEASLTVPANNLLVITSPTISTGQSEWNAYVSQTTNTETRQNSSPINIGTNWTEPTSGLVFGAGFPPVQPISYFVGDLVGYNDVVYRSLMNGNTDIPPTINWLDVTGNYAGAYSRLNLLWPLGTGPASDINTANVFRLPHGFLREAPEDPKAAARIYLGAPIGTPADDFVFEGNYFASFRAGPLTFRYVSDIVDVTSMDAMFCEMLAARIASEVAPRLGAAGLLQNVERHYQRERFKAITVNGIEIGPVTPVRSRYLTVRA